MTVCFQQLPRNGARGVYNHAIPISGRHRQAIELCQGTQLLHHVPAVALQFAYGVVVKVELLYLRHALAERRDILQPIDQVVVELQRVHFRQLGQAFNPFDQIETEVEPLKVGQLLKAVQPGHLVEAKNKLSQIAQRI
eukprot:scaffold3765_cov122-Isochrysis_galbana.AAC.13